VDGISYDFVKGATVDYEEELIRSAFVVSSKLWFFIFSRYFLQTRLVSSKYTGILNVLLPLLFKNIFHSRTPFSSCAYTFGR
jgi:iron-sulfur cluster assembly 2